MRDTNTPSEFSDVLAYLSEEQPALTNLYTAHLARNHLLGSPLASNLLQMLLDYFSLVEDSNAHQFYRNNVSKKPLPQDACQEPRFDDWQVRMHTTQSLGLLFKKELKLDDGLVELRLVFTTEMKFRLSL